MDDRLVDERMALIAKCAADGVDMELSDFTLYDGEWEIDGMPAHEWVEAMTME